MKQFIDLIKWKEEKPNALLMEGIGIFCVMLVHSGTPDKLYAFFSYGLASFIFARGFLWKERPFYQFVQSRIRLVITYYWAGLLNSLLFFLVVPERFLTKSRIDYFVNFLIVRLDRLNEIPINIVPTWFLVMLFIAELIYYWVRKSKYLVFLSFAAALIVRTIRLGPLPFKIDAAIAALPFFSLGELWRKRRIGFGMSEFLISLPVLAGISYFNGDISWNASAFGKNGLISLVGEILTIPLVAYVSGVLKKVRCVNLESFFYKLSFNALFIISYHFTVGAIIALPLLLFFGANLSSPVETLQKVWFIHFPLVLLCVYLIVEKSSQKMLSALTGTFWYNFLFELTRKKSK